MKEQTGFTLIELLVVIAILGILAAVGLHNFVSYKTRAFDARAESDLRNVATAEEAYYVAHEIYIACDEIDCVDQLPAVAGPSSGTLLEITVASTSFTGTSTNTLGSGRVFSWDSEGGGLQ